jgi:hypothetical protein
MTRTGKIARLPHSIRELLNRRLHNGEQGTKLLKWLNGLPAVQEVLAREFSGRPISEQNLSEWKQGGFEDWLRHEKTREWVRALAEESGDLGEEAGDVSVADLLSAPLAVALGRWINELTAGAQNDPGQRKWLLAIARELADLRRCDHEEERLRTERERREAEDQEKEDKELEERQAKTRMDEAYARIYLADAKCYYEEKLKAGTLSPDEEAKFQRIFAEAAEWERLREARRTPRIAPSDGNQTQSNQIKPNQTNPDKTA